MYTDGLLTNRPNRILPPGRHGPSASGVVQPPTWWACWTSRGGLAPRYQWYITPLQGLGDGEDSNPALLAGLSQARPSALLRSCTNQLEASRGFVPNPNSFKSLWQRSGRGLKARNMTARPEGPGTRAIIAPSPEWSSRVECLGAKRTSPGGDRHSQRQPALVIE